jgi:hypothetical protein
MVAGLVRVGGIVATESKDNQRSKSSNASSGCLEALLRVLVTLTHGEERWARQVVGETRGYPEGQAGPELIWLTALVKASGNSLRSVGVHSEAKVNQGNAGWKRKLQEETEDTDTEATDTASTSSSEDDAPTRQQQEQQTRAKSRVRALDRLCLALALLTNLVHVLNTIGDSMREAGTLEVLSEIYEQQRNLSEDVSSQEDSEAASEEREQVQADSTFLRGHLAVLFGLLMQENEENKEVILQLLPRRGESRAVKLTRLVDEARKFVSFFDVVQSSQHQDGLNEEEENEKKTSQRVADFLVELRDSC